MAKHRLWRCQNETCSEDAFGRLIFDFESDEPVCPKCGADQRKLEGSQVIVKRQVIHYLVIASDGPIVTPNGRRRIACQPSEKRLPSHASGAFTAVTCPSCQLSADYQKAADQEEVQHAEIVKINIG